MAVEGGKCTRFIFEVRERPEVKGSGWSALFYPNYKDWFPHMGARVLPRRAFLILGSEATKCLTLTTLWSSPMYI